MAAFNKDNYETIIGIDLGTTYSCVSYYNTDEDKVEVIPGPHGRTMPSWVAFTAEGKTVGTPAKSQVASNPNNTVYDIKRIIGRAFTDEIVQKEKEKLPYKIMDGGSGDCRVVVDWRGSKKSLSPEEISSFVLSQLKLDAEKHLGKPITKAVITVPAHFNNQQRQATKDAGRIAGLEVKRIINEPTAAALAYGLHSNEEEAAGAAKTDKSNVLIFDLGGGTFDVTCLTMNGGVFEVKSTGGDTHLGGEDFDDLTVGWALSKLEKDAREHYDMNKRAQSRLRRAMETAKRNLSSAQSTTVEVDSLVPGLDFSEELTRAEFEALNQPLFQKCMDTVTAVLKDAGVKTAEVTDIVLVGGSTRVPILQQKLNEMFGGRIELCKTIHPDEAVAIGAAVQGHILASGGKGGGQDLGAMNADLLLLDVTPLSLGIELEGRVMSTLIKRNTAIPTKKTRTYSTVDDWQTEIDIVVYEGERPCVDGNNKLGSFVISGVQKARAGEPKVDVTFSLDANGILTVSAEDQVTGAKANAEIKAEEGRLTADEVSAMIEDANKYRADDEVFAKKIELKSALEEAIFECSSIAKTKGDAAGETEIAQMMDWLELDADTADYDVMKKKAISLEEKFGVRII
ncbi:hypothetical protein TeGR_g5464 [Tetraparma gracilis]|uniref:Heat shock protein 70 n=1 Tax=Tetraparma gracilis TaxID=2962635 RepID=A0ABQ6M6Y8_9STRA|nr:hypothetical protein TeGR_g5464 [Tetraparma gracilis]